MTESRTDEDGRPWATASGTPPRTKRTEAASKARHLNALRRKAPAMVEALRELGYTVIEPRVQAAVTYEPCGCVTNSAGAHRRACGTVSSDDVSVYRHRGDGSDL